MTTMTTCQDCGATLDEKPNTPVAERRPCPRCGSTSRQFQKRVSDEVTLRQGLRLKARHENSREPFVEVKTGDDLFRESGGWNKL